MSALRELFVAFDVDTAAATSKIRQMETTLSGASQALGAIAGTIAGAFSFSIAKGFIEEQIEIGSKLNDTSEKLGIATGALQQFQFAAKLSGVDTEEAARSLGFLNKNLGLAITGGSEQAQFFQGLGINLKGVKDGSVTASDVLPKVADKIAGAGSDAERAAIAVKAFGKQGMSLLPALKGGSKELAAMNAEFQRLGGGMDEDFIKLADKAGDEADKFKFALQGLKSVVAKDVLPGVIDLAKKLQDGVVWFRRLTNETNIVKETVAVFGAVATAAAIKTAAAWGKTLGLFQGGEGGLLKSLLANAELVIVVALFVGLALVLEDIWTSINGGNGTIKEMISNLYGVEYANDLFENFKKTADTLAGVFSGMGPQVGQLGKMLLGLALDPLLLKAVEFLARWIGTLITLLVGAATAAGKVLSGDFKGAGKAVDQAGDAVFGQRGFFGSDYRNGTHTRLPGEKAPVDVPRAQDLEHYNPAAVSPSSPTFGAGVIGPPSNITQTNKIDINIQGGQTNEETGRVLSEELRKTFSGEIQNSMMAGRKGTSQ